MAPLITVTTDFGLADPYVAMMKAVILARVPGANIVDITHGIPPQDVLAAAFVLDRAWRFFPAGTIHLVVVDPGVGTARVRLVVSSGGQHFIGPDNGCLSAAMAPRRRRAAGAAYVASSMRLPEGVAAAAIEDLELLSAREPSLTFEGRDIFAPAAAHLACGGEPAFFGPPLKHMIAFPEFRAPRAGGALHGLVLAADHFGNLITDIRADDLPPSPVFEAGGILVWGLSRTYAEASGAAAVVGSSGYVELALPGGNAAQALGIERGSAVTARPA